jgi:hypothetical protein
MGVLRDANLTMLFIFFKDFKEGGFHFLHNGNNNKAIKLAVH